MGIDAFYTKNFNIFGMYLKVYTMNQNLYSTDFREKLINQFNYFSNLKFLIDRFIRSYLNFYNIWTNGCQIFEGILDSAGY